jgi:hypothetical protein
VAGPAVPRERLPVIPEFFVAVAVSTAGLVEADLFTPAAVLMEEAPAADSTAVVGAAFTVAVVDIVNRRWLVHHGSEWLPGRRRLPNRP